MGRATTASSAAGGEVRGPRHRRPVAEVRADRDDGDGLGAIPGRALVVKPCARRRFMRALLHGARRIVTLTSSNGTVMGACGLWIVTSTASTRAAERASAMRCDGLEEVDGLAGETAATWSATSP
jgi:hypothetical protein